ncbi:MAG: 23S rRNA (uracil(1939)-C(5))-methyltransferase RlmD [Deltaproteobacteria bacterium]|nr:MAG: 23S rRNA (uracil(1939)-C(5))-methyltransferase RlmD [Deltaproteobacteria bacterium]
MTQTNAKSTATLEIDALSYGPYGIGRLDGKAIMVPYTAPGDRVEVRITEEKERYDIGEAIRVLAPSLLRQAPPCPYVGACGGCSWQHLRYDAQLKAKQQSVVDALRRIGRLGDFELRPIIPSNDEFHYRRRIRLQVGGNRTLGFYGTASHQLVEIGSCLIANDRLNGALDSVRRWVRALATPLEYVEIVAGEEPEEIVVVARAIGPFAPNDEPACANLSGESKQIRGLIVGGADWRRVWDKAAISVSLLADLSLSLDADVFTQVNAEGNRSILKALLAAGDFQSSDRVLELYCGGGNFTLPIAQRTKEIVAVEGYKASIANGKLNAQKNSIDNIRWICSAVPKAVAELKRKREQFTKIVLDPPRAGAKGLEADLAALRANQIFYISWL